MRKQRLHNQQQAWWSILVAVLLLLPTSLQAAEGDPLSPEHYRIGELFNKYAKAKHSSFVRIDSEALASLPRKPYNINGATQIITLILSQPTREIVEEVALSLEADRDESDDMQEVFANGYLISAYYRLAYNDTESAYLLYRYDLKRGRVVLIYLRGKITNQELMRIINRTYSVKKYSINK